MAGTKDSDIKTPPRQRIKLRYKGYLGQLPKEIDSYIHCKRKDPVTKITKIVPEIVYPLKAHRMPLPKHALLEDDYRAYKSVFLNFQQFFRKQQTASQLDLEMSQVAVIAKKILGQRKGMPPTLMSRVAKIQPGMAPELSVYQGSVEHPPGYLYRHYMNGIAASKPQKVKRHPIPKIIFEGAFQNVVHVPHGPNEKRNRKREVDMYDADVLVGGPTNNESYIYNEPDAVPVQFARLDFSVPLDKRCLKISNEHQSEVHANDIVINIPLVLPSGEKVFPAPELLMRTMSTDQGPLPYLAGSNASDDSVGRAERYAGAIHGL